MDEADIKRGIFVVRRGDVHTLIFIKDGVPDEYNFLDSFGMELVEAMMDKLKSIMAVFNEESSA